MGNSDSMKGNSRTTYVIMRRVIFAPRRCQPESHHRLLLQPRGDGPVVWPVGRKHWGQWRHSHCSGKLHQSKSRFRITRQCLRTAVSQNRVYSLATAHVVCVGGTSPGVGCKKPSTQKKNKTTHFCGRQTEGESLCHSKESQHVFVVALQSTWWLCHENTSA